eukprot:TRINITY_DN4877_c6_g1_i1.p1 TRINITY_DN4877_c6_g1~~TRINITY_DN4877_c6_g1_i1.p1  ORF type:complete len:696 (+),score=194.96 TRINITY_DN4877_c6_g1_i1:174-2090(+)
MAALTEFFPGIRPESLRAALAICGGRTKVAEELAGSTQKEFDRWLAARGAQRGSPGLAAAQVQAARGATEAHKELGRLAAALAKRFAVGRLVAMDALRRCGGRQDAAAELIAACPPGRSMADWIAAAPPAAAAAAAPALQPAAKRQRLDPSAQPLPPPQLLPPQQPQGPPPGRPDPAILRLAQVFSAVEPETISRVLEVCAGSPELAAEVLSGPPEGIARCMQAAQPGKRPVRMLQCPICIGEVPADEMYWSGCADPSHRICHECVLDMARSSLAEKKRVQCPHERCAYLFSDEDVRRMRWPPAEAKRVERDHSDILMQGALGEIGAIACPTAGCSNWVELHHPDNRQAVHCSRCLRQDPRPPTAVFCSRCRAPHHYVVSCPDVPRITADWLRWCEGGRAEARERWRAEGRELAKQFAEQEAKTKARNAELRKAWDRLRKDEQWKEKHCRACPKCGVAIQRISGCDSMRCGEKAQGGCGTHFNWARAERYVSSMPELREAAGPEKRNLHDAWFDWGGANCDLCQKPLKGPRFQCIHCPAADYCHRCEERGSTADEHRNHVFRILTDSTDFGLEAEAAAAAAGGAAAAARGPADGGLDWGDAAVAPPAAAPAAAAAAAPAAAAAGAPAPAGLLRRLFGM